MSKICFLVLIFFSFSGRLKAQNLTRASFTKTSHIYKIDTTIDVAVLFKDNFYCLKSDHEIIVINKEDNQIESEYRDNSKSLNLSNLYTVNDSLIGLNKLNTYYLDQKTKTWLFLRKGWQIPAIYEDKDYKVISTCSGEFGGSLYFRDKKTDRLYECISTCTTNVIKEGNKYLIAASLPHLMGFVYIFEVDDPSKLKLYNRTALERKRTAAKKKNQIFIGTVGEDESNSKDGTNKLIDTIGVISPLSFLVNSTVYYIIEKSKNVHIDAIINHKLVEVDDLTSFNIWGDDMMNRTCEEKQISTFNNDSTSGFICVDKNNLTFYTFNRNK